MYLLAAVHACHARPSLRLTDCHGRQIPILGTRSITQIQIQIQIRFTDITRQIPIDGSVQSENKDGIPQAMAGRRTMPEKVFVDQHDFCQMSLKTQSPTPLTDVSGSKES